MLDTANRALLTGIAALATILLIAVLSGRMAFPDTLLLLSRAAHVFTAMVWVGLIWFVNVVQLAVLAEADDPAKKTVLTWVVPRVAKQFKLMANLTFVTGLLLLAELGYLTQRPVGSLIWLWLGVLGGTAMLGFVHAKIAPALRVVLDSTVTDAATKAAARNTVRIFARCNLLLALPVTFAMLAGAHG